LPRAIVNAGLESCSPPPSISLTTFDGGSISTRSGREWRMDGLVILLPDYHYMGREEVAQSE